MFLEQIIRQATSIIRPPEKLTISQWTEKYRYINNPGSYVGNYSFDKTPYMREPVDALSSLDFTGMVFAGPARTGKALALDTPIPTPTGWTTMGELREGDRVFDESGSECRVTFATEVMQNHQCYQLTFDDGSQITADAGHKWTVRDAVSENTKTLTTSDLITGQSKSKRTRYAVAVGKPLVCDDARLPIDPYILGVWLGDGSTLYGHISCGAGDVKELVRNIELRGYKAKVYCANHRSNAAQIAIRGPDGVPLENYLATERLGGDYGKHIPGAYLRASIEQRKELLRGLCDTDGSLYGRCGRAVQFSNSNIALAEQAAELVRSLGYKARTRVRPTHYIKNGVRVQCSDTMLVQFTTYNAADVFAFQRKIAVADNASDISRPTHTGYRFIKRIDSVPTVPVRCITVDSRSHLFLAGNAMIPTHNSDSFFNWMGFSADNDPADMLFYAMTQSRASEWAQRDFRKMIRSKKSGEAKSILQRLLRPGKENIFDKHFINGMQLMVRWPSITELSGKTVPRVWLEDYDRIPSVDDIEHQGSAFDLARKRTTTYKRFGMTAAEASPGFEVTQTNWIAATPHEAPPTQGILGIYNRGDRRRWYWRCPDCEETFEPTFDLLSWPEEGENLERAEQTVLVCPHCGVAHAHGRKFEMNRTGRWLREGEVWNKDGTVTGTPRRSDIASFWMQGPAAGFQTWEGLTLAYLNAMDEYRKTGSMGPLKKTMNTDQGVPFVPPRDEMARLPETLKSRAEDWGGGRDYDTRLPTVPDWVRFLVATIDVQKRSFVVQITGIGEHGEMTVIDVFKIRHSERFDENHPLRPVLPIDPAGHAEDWNLLISEVIERTYPLADGSGRRMAIKITGCDSGGRDGVTPNAVKFWLSLQRDEQGRNHHRRFHLLKGDTVKDGKWERMTSFFEANSNSTMNFFKGKVPFQRLNSNPLKDRLNVVLMRDEPGGARMRYPEWMPNWFYTQMCNEERIAGKGWSPPKGDRRNESWDLSYYCLALCAHPDIKLDYIRWEEPEKVPAWAKPWDENALVIKAEEVNPLVEKKGEIVDMREALSAFG